MTGIINELKIADLTLLDNNPRQVRTGAIQRLAKSLSSPQGRSLFEKRPCLVNKRDGKLVVYAGNQRLRAAQSLKWATVPCIVDEISLEQEREETIKDNLVIGEWDDDLLANNFDLKDLEDWGMDLKELGIEPLGDDETDEVPEPPKEARAERGKIYQLGKHRVMCGDSTNAGDVALLMDGKKADMVFTDPPYGVSYTGGIQFKNGQAETESREMIEGDKTSNIYSSVIPILSEICSGPIYTWFADTKALSIYDAIEKCGEIHALIIWVKNGGFGALNANYKQKHEPCLYWCGKGSRLGFVGPTNETTVWNIDKDGRNKLHPTQKPIDLALKAIKNHETGIVADIFLGSGSTLIACEQTGRICYGMEIDPRYVDVVIERFCNYTKTDKEEIYGKAS